MTKSRIRTFTKPFTATVQAKCNACFDVYFVITTHKKKTRGRLVRVVAGNINILVL